MVKIPRNHGRRRWFLARERKSAELVDINIWMAVLLVDAIHAGSPSMATLADNVRMNLQALHESLFSDSKISKIS